MRFQMFLPSISFVAAAAVLFVPESAAQVCRSCATSIILTPQQQVCLRQSLPLLMSISGDPVIVTAPSTCEASRIGEKPVRPLADAVVIQADPSVIQSVAPDEAASSRDARGSTVFSLSRRNLNCLANLLAGHPAAPPSPLSIVFGQDCPS